jgi:hypothetical protein
MLVSCLFMMLFGLFVMVGYLFCHGLLHWMVRCSMPKRQRAACSQSLSFENTAWSSHSEDETVSNFQAHTYRDSDASVDNSAMLGAVFSNDFTVCALCFIFSMSPA